MDEDLQKMVAEEFKLIGFMARPNDVATLSESLAAQGAEYGEVGVSAACIGYATAKGMRW